MIRILGDGVAGRLVAAQLRAAGHASVVFGDGRAAQQPCALVHRYAGRSFRRPDIEDRAWAAARPWLESLVERGAARALEIARPVDSRAGARLGASLEFAEDVRRAEVAGVGECFVYGPAFVVDVPAALAVCGSATEVEEDASIDVLAVGARWDHPEVEHHGGHLVSFDWDQPPLDVVVSGGGIHVAPFGGGACVGSTFWPADAPMEEGQAHDELRKRAARLGIRLGNATQTWAGVRAVSSDRRPCIGRDGEALVVGALGTRGWFWAALCARQTAAYLAEGAPVCAELALERFGP